ncbi:hypothetical protein THAOC_20876 [Thalassiosira oceanica]|uniref:Uncharacterized protein n=1 Tax=Thalassiosira oceanica TaxID=159749 RepID=K0S0W1_THAOC|nr:hypothetical protein THAOC_20876 [Thalassiosira oceanica]|eukprot:EJK58965.1 hypothetical protein THAOC_20876 [Thalassiosira oceanica]
MIKSLLSVFTAEKESQVTDLRHIKLGVAQFQAHVRVRRDRGGELKEEQLAVKANAIIGAAGHFGIINLKLQAEAMQTEQTEIARPGDRDVAYGRVESLVNPPPAIEVDEVRPVTDHALPDDALYTAVCVGPHAVRRALGRDRLRLGLRQGRQAEEGVDPPELGVEVELERLVVDHERPVRAELLDCVGRLPYPLEGAAEGVWTRLEVDPPVQRAGAVLVPEPPVLGQA